jgi:hypothetical protein
MSSDQKAYTVVGQEASQIRGRIWSPLGELVPPTAMDRKRQSNPSFHMPASVM